MEEREACGMHDGDKIRKSAIVNLTPSININKAVVNKFEAGVKLSLKFQDMVQHSKRTLEHCNRYKAIVGNNPEECPVSGI